MISFLLADDHSIVRHGLKTLIRENFSFKEIHEVNDSGEVLRSIQKYHYDLLILDINMPGLDFTNLFHRINSMAIGPRVFVFTAFPENAYGLRCLHLGAFGFLTKTASNSEICIAIERIVEGKKYVSAALTHQLLDGNIYGPSHNPFQGLSSREMEIVLLLNSGKSLPEISSQLNIQYTTANTYKRRIFEKLRVDNIVSLSRLMHSYQVGV